MTIWYFESEVLLSGFMQNFVDLAETPWTQTLNNLELIKTHVLKVFRPNKVYELGTIANYISMGWLWYALRLRWWIECHMSLIECDSAQGIRYQIYT